MTGGTRGIGEAVSMALQEQGYTVVANYGGNDEVAKAFTERTGIPSFKFDVSNFQKTKVAIEQIENDYGSIDILVNNAGITRDGTMHKMSYEQWDAVIQTNLAACFNTCRWVIDGMRQRGFGRIVTLAP